MADEGVSLGQAVAAGTTATVDRRNPFDSLNQAVRYKQQMDLQKEARAAQEAQRKEATRQAIMSRVKVLDGKTTVWNAKRKQGILADYMLEATEAARMGNEEGRIMAQQKAEMRASEVDAHDSNINNFTAAAKSKEILGEEIVPYVMRGDAEGLKELYKKKPELAVIAPLDPKTGQVSFNFIKKIDRRAVYAQAKKDLEDSAEYTGRDVTYNNNTKGYEHKASPEQVEGYAAILASDPNFVANMHIDRPDDFKKAINEIKPANGAPVDDEQLVKAAAIKLISEDLESQNKYEKTIKKAMPTASQLDREIVKPILSPGSFTVKVPGQGGVSVPVNINAPYSESIGMDNTPVSTSGLIDMGTGKPVGGTGNVIAKTGQIATIPVFKKGTIGVSPKTGKRADLSGQAVSDEDIVNLNQAQASKVEYVPALVIVSGDPQDPDTQYKRIKGGGDLSGLPKFDQVNARAKFNFAVEVAANKNKELSSSMSSRKKAPVATPAAKAPAPRTKTTATRTTWKPGDPIPKK